MSTYNQLLADIVSWLDNDELQTIAPTLVTLAESRHKRDLRLRAMERRSLANGQDSRYLPLPQTEPFLEMRRLRMDNINELMYVPPEALKVKPQGSRPQRYTVHQEIEFDQTASTEQEFEILYYTPFTALDPDNQTNWLITNAYDAYLFAALAEAGAYMYEDERVAGWASKYQAAAQTLQREDDRGRVNQGEARMVLSEVAP